MTATITPIEHWCTDGECNAEVVEVRGGAKKIRRWKLTVDAIAWGFDTKEEASEFAASHGYEVE
jgi:hypothetical protein